MASFQCALDNKISTSTCPRNVSNRSDELDAVWINKAKCKEKFALHESITFNIREVMFPAVYELAHTS